MFGMFLIFPKLALKCAMDPLTSLVNPLEDDAPDVRNTSHVAHKISYKLDEPADGK